MKIGLLTGGGDCPGLNAVIRAVVRKGTNFYGDQFVGFLEGWRGVLDNKAITLDLAAVLSTAKRVNSQTRHPSARSWSISER